MKTIVEGIQVTNIQIKQNCRKTHGTRGALEEAIAIIKVKYFETVNTECNKAATFNLCLTVDR